MTATDDLLADAHRCLAARAYDEAETRCRQLLAARPGDRDALHILGSALINLSRAGEAADLLRDALAQEPADVETRYNYALALYLCGNFDEALNQLRAVLAGNPTYALAHFRVGLIHHQRGDFDKASSCYRRALGLDRSLNVAQECLEAAAARLFFGSGGGFQGAHAPERQVFLSAAVHALRDSPEPLKILEIGSYMGASALTLAHAIHRLAEKSGSILCIDPWLPALSYENKEMNLMLAHHDGAYQAFLRNIATVPASVAVDHRRGLSRDILPTLPASSFDVVYIDGSHIFDEVLQDIRDADRVLRLGGFLCGDDLELQAHECDRANAQRSLHLDTVVDPATGTLFHPGVTFAVEDILGRVSAYGGFWIMRKEQSGYSTVDLSGREGLLPQHWPKSTVDRLRARFNASGELRRVHG